MEYETCGRDVFILQYRKWEGASVRVACRLKKEKSIEN